MKLIKSSILLFILFLITLYFFSGLLLAQETITVIDSDGFVVDINLPIESIVCLNPALNEILIALGVGDKIIARDELSAVSPSLQAIKDLPVVASSSLRPQIEAIIALNPDIIIADTMLQVDARKKFKSFNIPAIAERTSESTNLIPVIRRLAKITAKKEKGEELISYIKAYRNLIKKRVAQIKEEEKTLIFWERKGIYQTGNNTSTIQARIDLVGGINLAAETKTRYPIVSSEYVIEKNPEVIIRMETRGTPLKALQKSYQGITTRVGLNQTKAVKNNRVHIVSWAVNSGLPSIVGDLYFAKFAHPQLFTDIEPEYIYQELMEKFFNIKIKEQLVYP